MYFCTLVFTGMIIFLNIYDFGVLEINSEFDLDSLEMNDCALFKGQWDLDTKSCIYANKINEKH